MRRQMTKEEIKQRDIKNIQKQLDLLKDPEQIQNQIFKLEEELLKLI